MTGRGIVRDVTDDSVSILYCGDRDCEGCHNCGHLFKEKEKILQAKNRTNQPLNPGDTVEVFLAPWKAVRAAFIVLILPLLLFFLFYYAGSRLLGIEKENLQVLLGVGGIILGFLISLIRKLLSRQTELPEIVRVLVADEQRAESGR